MTAKPKPPPPCPKCNISPCLCAVRALIAKTPAPRPPIPGCALHAQAVITCLECRKLPHVEKVVQELRDAGVLGSVD